MPNIVHPDKGYPNREDDLRRDVREALGLGWEARDAQIVAEVRRLKRFPLAMIVELNDDQKLEPTKTMDAIVQRHALGH